MNIIFWFDEFNDISIFVYGSVRENKEILDLKIYFSNLQKSFTYVFSLRLFNIKFAYGLKLFFVPTFFVRMVVISIFSEI